jgi:hypothetical protein
MAIRYSALYLWFLVSACASEPKSALEHSQVQKEVATDVARVCALPPAERESEIARVRSNEGIAIVCPAIQGH